MTDPNAHPTEPLRSALEEDRDLGFQLPAAPEVSKRKLALVAVGLAAAIGVLFVLGLLPKLQRQALAREEATARQAPPRVQIMKARRAKETHSLTLPASVQALQATDIYPRASGYVRRWVVDMGDRVKAGQLLAEIDTPELDQQLEQSRATLGQRDAAVTQAKANVDLAKAMLARYQALAPGGFASQQELEQRQAESQVAAANLQAAAAAVAAQRADVRRLQQLKAFARLTAPFAGAVVMRSVEQGMLVTGGSRLFTIAQTDPVRVFVQIPQSLAAGVEPGLPAEVSVREFPGRTFPGRVTRTAGALDPTSRTLNTEVQVPNPKGELLAGMYAQATLTLHSSAGALLVPAGAVLARSEGLRVAVVGKDSKVHMVPITIGRDDGAEVEISSGLSGDEDIVSNPGARIEEGLQVEVGRS